jgi:hypothetical protein
MGISIVEVITAGPQGIQGVPGNSANPGGLNGQALVKVSNLDFDTDWRWVAGNTVSYTTTEGLTAVDVQGAINEVEHSRKEDRAILDAVRKRGEVDTDTLNLDVDTIMEAGIYIVDDTCNLPNSIVNGELVVKVGEDPNTTVYQELLDRDTGNRYERSYGTVWSTWEQTIGTKAVKELIENS